jgi:hypothetical protein
MNMPEGKILSFERGLNFVEKDKQKIVDDIIKSKKEHLENSAYIVLYTAELYYGSKKIEISIDFSNNRISTKIENIHDESQKKSQESTLLYMASKKIIQEQVDNLGSPLTYSLITHYKKIKLWAESTGKKIFDWDKIEEEETDAKETSELSSVKTIFSKEFRPSVPQQKEDSEQKVA